MEIVNKVAVQSAVEAYVNHLNTIAKGNYAVSVDEGRKFYKVVQQHIGGPATGNKSVHSFVDKETGGLYKAASWAQPAKGVRYDLVKNFDQVRQVADIHGSYLYKK